jgi:hypothetical protein
MPNTKAKTKLGESQSICAYASYGSEVIVQTHPYCVGDHFEVSGGANGGAWRNERQDHRRTCDQGRCGMVLASDIGKEILHLEREVG